MNGKQAVSVVPFSHLDLFWGGTREECLSRGSHIIRTALDLLERYPEYRFMIESTNFIEHYLDCFPEDAPRLRRLSEEGRVELIPMRAIIYSQLPDGETAVRNLLYGRDDCRSRGLSFSAVMSLSDIPGATPQTPQIAVLAGMEALVLSRGCPEHTDQILWRALDGSHLPTYYPWHYGGACGCLSNPDYSKMLEGEAKFEQFAGAVDYPQVMHWGMDLYVLNESILENIRRWNREGHRELRFSTFREFFRTHQSVPTCEVRGEIPSFWPNIESSWPDIWPLDLPCEYQLFRAEHLQCLLLLSGTPELPAQRRAALRTAWGWLLDGMDHNQNGVGGMGADDDKRRLKTTAEAVARQEAERCARQLAARVSPPRSGAFAVVVFNPLGWRRSERVQAHVTLYGQTLPWQSNWGTPEPYRLTDEEGHEVPMREVSLLTGLSNAPTIEFLAEDVPAFGARVYYVEPSKPEKFPSPFKITDNRAARCADANQPIGKDVCTNGHFRIEIDRISGTWDIFEAGSDKALVRDIALLGLEELGGDYICRMPLSGRIIPALLESVEWRGGDAVSCRAEIRGSVYGQPFVQTITLDARKAEIEVENVITWRNIRPVRIEQAFTFATDKPEIRYGVPFGQVTFPQTVYGEAMPFERVALPELGNISDPNIRNIRLAQHWIAGSRQEGSVVIGADHRMWEIDGQTVRNCLIRGIAYTSGGQQVMADGTRAGNVRPPKGEYRFRFRIAPLPTGQTSLGRCGWELNRPLHCVSQGDSGTAGSAVLRLPVLPDGTDTTVVIANMKPAENGGVVLRCFEGAGQNAALSLPTTPGWRWQETDLLEDKAADLQVEVLDFRPFEIKTLLLLPADPKRRNADDAS